jgi:hypothetical protein
MEYKILKKIVGEYLVNKGFSKKGNYYCIFLNELIIVVGFQKANFSNGCYINIGYCIPLLNADIKLPRDVDGDVRARFVIEVDLKENSLFDLDRITNDDLLTALENNYMFYVNGINSIDKLKTLIGNNPVLLYQTTLKAKQFLKLI